MKIITRKIDQSKLTSECWLIQFQGIKAYLQCEFKDTDECGGENIRTSGLNDKGFEIPLGNRQG